MTTRTRTDVAAGEEARRSSSCARRSLGSATGIDRSTAPPAPSSSTAASEASNGAKSETLSRSARVFNVAESGGQLPPGASLEETLMQYERELITRTLEAFHYNLAKAADQLKITRHALRYRVQRLNIQLHPDAQEADENTGRGTGG